MDKYRINGVYISSSPYCNGEAIRITGLGKGIVYYTILNGDWAGEDDCFYLGSHYDKTLQPYVEDSDSSRAKNKFKVGDRIRFRAWDDMEREYGLNKYGSIQTPIESFVESMRFLCGTEATIKEIRSDKISLEDFEAEGDTVWAYTSNMIEPATKKKFKVGDRVRIRAWNDMEREYGITANKDIKVPHYLFCAEMKHLCGTTATIKEIEDDRIYLEGTEHERANWFYTADMLELVKNRKEMFESRCKVRFRSWEDMKEEFGLTPWGDIDTPVYRFRKEMKDLCGTSAIISEIKDNVVILKNFKYEDEGIWTYTLDMVEMIEKMREFKVGQIYKVNNKTSEEHNEVIQISTVSDSTIYYNNLKTTSKGEKYWERNITQETHYFDCFKAYSEFANNLILLTDVIEVPVQVDFELDLNETKKDRFKIGRKFHCNDPKYNSYSMVIEIVEVQETYFLYKMLNNNSGCNGLIFFDDPFISSLVPYIKKEEPDFKIGDLVRIRQWDDMVEEFGIHPCNTIQLKYSFPPEMKYLCGCVAVIEEMNDEDGDEDEVKLTFTDGVDSGVWRFSLDMLEPVASEELLNIKAVCLSDEFPEYWTKGYEYYFINGRITNDKGEESRQYRSLDEFFNEYDVELIEVFDRPVATL